MSGPSWYFFHQAKSIESAWTLGLAEDREKIVREVKPAFVTVLDLSSVPDNNDWTGVRYRGPLYFDFDADGDLELVCEQFKLFLYKLGDEVKFDISQARLFLSGGKGMHVEIPQTCFIPKVPTAGTAWLPYIYRAVAESLIVETLDLKVYSGKKGRQWRTPNVKRENGNYKVQIPLDVALTITPELYLQLVSQPSDDEVPVTPPSCNSTFSMLFERSKEKVVKQMRGKKRRQEVANTFLDPWKKAKRTPPTIEMIMSGENLSDEVGFQQIAMQLSIYAATVGMDEAEFLDRCKGLCEKHVSDGGRYNTVQKRRTELSRMLAYMDSDSLYDFETAPMARLVKCGVPVEDLGVMETEDREDTGPTTTSQPEGDTEDGDTATATVVEGDQHKGVRKGFFMNATGMWKRLGENTDCICRATLRKVEGFYSLEPEAFRGYEFDIVAKGMKTKRTMLSADAFTSSAKLRQFFANHQLSFQGGDFEAMSLLDVMSEKARRGGRVIVYPREGFFVIDNPNISTPVPVKVYLTKDTFINSVPATDPDYFVMRYRAENAESTYNIDIHRAPELDESMIPALQDLFAFNREDLVANLLGWFVAAHYRSLYLKEFRQFPMLQIYGEAGSGKTQTVLMLGRLHWYMNDISINSAMSSTNFAVDSLASTSTSAPLVIDEYKPRELRMIKGRIEKLKDMFKAAYVGGNIGNRGTVNKGAENNLAVIKSRATAPVVFMGEAIEPETAIVERSVTVPLSKQYQTKARRMAFDRLQSNGMALSALGRAIVEMGFLIDTEAMKQEVRDLQAGIEASMPEMENEDMKRAAPRMIFNRAIVKHGLLILQRVLGSRFGTVFDASVASLLNSQNGQAASDEAQVMASMGMSEISKVISRIALLSREVDTPHEMKPDKDYIVGDGWVEILVERSYDQYRRYCASIHDTPLFDSLDTFGHALNTYGPVTDRSCAGSALRKDGSSERIVRFDSRKLNREGVQSFRV